MVFYFKTVVERGIMAGRDYNAPRRLPMNHTKGNRGCRKRSCRDLYGNPLGGQHAGGFFSKGARHKTSVKTDKYESLADRGMGLDIRSRSGCHQAKVFEGEIIGDDAAPAVRSETHSRHPRRLIWFYDNRPLDVRHL